MSSVSENIIEQRNAFEELRVIYSHIKAKYDGNPPVEELTALAELAALYRMKYGCKPNKITTYSDIEYFCMKNNLLPTKKLLKGRVTL